MAHGTRILHVSPIIFRESGEMLYEM